MLNWSLIRCERIFRGLNADAGVAQLVSALASLRDLNSAFDATPFAAPSDPGTQAAIAAEVR